MKASVHRQQRESNDERRARRRADEPMDGLADDQKDEETKDVEGTDSMIERRATSKKREQGGKDER